MPSFLKNTTSFTWLILMIGLFSCLFFLKFRWTDEQKLQRGIDSDGKGYYVYLPAIFIYGDLEYRFQTEISEKYPYSLAGHTYCISYKGKKYVNKYWAGVALMQSPFFFSALALSKISGQDADGYSPIFQVAIGISAIFYLLVGLFFLQKFLRFYVRESAISAVLLLIVAGTNLLYYTWLESSMSHVYSFAAITAFLYQGKSFFRHGSRKNLYAACGLFALILWIRPPNALILFALPFLAGSASQLKESLSELLRDKIFWVLGLSSFLLVIGLQSALFYQQSGEYFVYSYGEESLDFFHPEILNVLFSYRKGLFVYTPLCFVALWGFVFLWKKSRYEALSLALLLLLCIWVLSSWQTWAYGGSYGLRPFIDFYAIFALLLGLLLENLKSKFAIYAFSSLLGFLIFLNLVQSYQRWQNILPWDYTTSDIYWHIFLQTDASYQGLFTPSPPKIDNHWGHSKRFFSDMEERREGWAKTDSLIEYAQAHSAKKVGLISFKDKRGICFHQKIGSIPADSVLLVQVSTWIYLEDLDKSARLAVAVESGQKAYFREDVPLLPQIRKTKSWEKISVELLVPAVKNIEDNLAVYVFSSAASPLYVDDMEVQYLYYPKIKGK